MMRLHSLQHSPLEGPEQITDWADKQGHDLTETYLFDREPLPELNEFDWLIVLSGPMSVHDEDEYPWLVDEKGFIRQAIDADKIVLGLGLGSQLVADTLGAGIHKNERDTRGWGPVTTTEEAKVSPLFYNLANEYEAFHGHTDTFNLPEGATRMARSEGYPNRAFVYGDRVVGIQFHLDPPEWLAEILLHQTKSLRCGEINAQDSPSNGQRPEDTDRPIEGPELVLHNLDYCFNNEHD
jgi:GMP synthase-like glutamine amidotransferase